MRIRNQPNTLEIFGYPFLKMEQREDFRSVKGGVKPGRRGGAKVGHF
jgi:hypothetical protein